MMPCVLNVTNAVNGPSVVCQSKCNKIKRVINVKIDNTFPLPKEKTQDFLSDDMYSQRSMNGKQLFYMPHHLKLLICFIIRGNIVFVLFHELILIFLTFHEYFTLN